VLVIGGGPKRPLDRGAAEAAQRGHADRRPRAAHRRQLEEALSRADPAQPGAVNHLPYMLFPPSWPTYIPKDKLANCFESYVDAWS